MTKSNIDKQKPRDLINDHNNRVSAMKVMVACPACHEEFDAGTAIQQVVEDQAEAQVAARQAELMKKEDDLARGQVALEEQIRQRLEVERKKLSDSARAAIRDEFGVQLQAKEDEAAEIRSKLKDSQKRELEVIAQKRQLEAKEAELQLELQRKLEAERKAIQESMQVQADQQRQMALAEQEVELTALRKSTAAAKAQEKELARQAAELAKEKANIETILIKRIDSERATLSAKAQATARMDFAAQLEAKEIEAADSRAKLKAAQKKELEFLQQKRQLEDDAATLDLTVQRRIAEERQQIRQDATSKAQEQMDLAIREKDLLVQRMLEQMDDMKRQLDQGSQQAQGEAQELLLEELLRQAFPADLFKEVAKGVEGADVLQAVRDSQGRECGTILWESKRTKNWVEAWLGKLQADRARENASIAALATQALPKGIANIGQVDDVWVCAFSHAVPMARLLRTGMLETAAARKSLENVQDKMNMLYRYLASGEFRSRAETVARVWDKMLDNLCEERKAMEKLWAERERLLRMASAGMQGLQSDLQAIAGAEIVVLPASDEGIRRLEALSDATLIPPAAANHAISPEVASPGAGERAQKEALFLDKLFQKGGKATNSSLREALKMTEADYEEIKKRLVIRNQVVSGKGRGGTVRLRSTDV